MGKKRKAPQITAEEAAEKPICYYCNGIFSDISFLIEHQKAKHFKCVRCNKRMSTIGGLTVHMDQVHKEKNERVENAVPGRDDPKMEIFGVYGFPEELMNQHKLDVKLEFARREAAFTATTGNPLPGQKREEESALKKQRTETSEERKIRLEAFKAKKRAEKAAKANGGAVPMEAVQQEQAQPEPVAKNDNESVDTDDVVIKTTPDPLPAAPAFYPGNFGYDQTPTFNQAYPPLSAGPGYPLQPPLPYSAPYSGSPMSAYAPNTSTHPVGWFPGNAYLQGPSPMPQQLRNTYTGSPAGAAGSPSNGYNANMQNDARPPPPPPLEEAEQPLRTNSLPFIPGLPARPSFNMPNPTKEDMAKMHSGQRHELPAKPAGPAYFPNGASSQLPPPPPPAGPYNQPAYSASSPVYNNPHQGYIAPDQSYIAPGQGYQAPPPPNASQAEKTQWKLQTSDNIDDLIASVTGQASAPPQQAKQDVPATPTPEAVESKHLNEAEPLRPDQFEAVKRSMVAAETFEPVKKKKDNKASKKTTTKLVISDNAISPEEKRSEADRYAVDPR